MLLSKDFFDLNLKFARRVAGLTGQNIEEALLGYTHLYLAFGFGRDFDPNHSIWQSYLGQILSEADPAEVTHRFYLERLAAQPEPQPQEASSFGCFSYALWDGNRVRLHFHNATGQGGVLQKHQAPQRLAELRQMFQHLSKFVPVSATVVGGSWLYNIEAYCRLFPANYLESATAAEDEYQFLALWGQFLRADGGVRQHAVEAFLDAIEEQKTLAGLAACFPYRVLRLESSIQDFYSYHAIE